MVILCYNTPEVVLLSLLEWYTKIGLSFSSQSRPALSSRTETSYFTAADTFAGMNVKGSGPCNIKIAVVVLVVADSSCIKYLQRC